MGNNIQITLLCYISFTMCLYKAIGGSTEFPNLPEAYGNYQSTKEKALSDIYVLAFINYTYTSADGKFIHFSEEKARYGEGKIKNVQGVLIHVTSGSNLNDHTGCTPEIRDIYGETLQIINVPWIALIQRGNCTFEKKINHAWINNASGVIVYNDEDSMNLEKMKIIQKERNITAVFTYKYIGEEIARILRTGREIWVSISEGHRGLRPPPYVNKTSIFFVSISFGILLIILLIWIILYYLQRLRYLQSKKMQTRHICLIAKRIICKIPTKNWANECKDNESECCAICIDSYKPTDCIRILPCKHEFHKNCIDPWLLEHRTCPMCKIDVLKHYGFVVGDHTQKISTFHFVYYDSNSRNVAINEFFNDNAASTDLVASNDTSGELIFANNNLVSENNDTNLCNSITYTTTSQHETEI